MLDEQNGDTLFVDALDQLQRVLHFGGVQTCHNFVHHNQLGLSDQHAGQVQPLTLLDGDLAAEDVGIGLQLGHLQNFSCLGIGIPLVVLLQGDGIDVFINRQVAEGLGGLESTTHTQLGALCDGHILGDFLSLEEDLTCILMVNTGDQVNGGGLAGAVGSDQCQDLTAVDVHIQILNCLDTAEGNRQSLGLKKMLCHIKLPPLLRFFPLLPWEFCA